MNIKNKQYNQANFKEFIDEQEKKGIKHEDEMEVHILIRSFFICEITLNNISFEE